MNKTPIELIHEANKARIRAALERGDQQRRQHALDLRAMRQRERDLRRYWLEYDPACVLSPRLASLLFAVAGLGLCASLYWFLATHFQ